MARGVRAAALFLAALQSVPMHPLEGQGQAQVVPVGRCQLAGGGTISDCRVAYRSFGQLNATRSNGVLIPTWLLGRSEDWISFLGPRGYVDTTQLYVIVVDALGNGRSSSPSTVPTQERPAFRGLTIGDMVVSQHRLLTEHLGISHLHAVVGFSMGGMQALEWAVRFPTFLDMAVPIAGTPRIGAFDRLMWTTMLAEIEAATRSHAPADSVWAQLARLEALFLRTPVAVNELGWDSVLTEAAVQAKAYRQTWTLEDYEAQLLAIRRHDISLGFSSELSGAAKAVRARVFIVHSLDDHMVTAGAAFGFARMIRAETLSVPSTCGHVAFFCDQERLSSAVRNFLAQ